MKWLPRGDARHLWLLWCTPQGTLLRPHAEEMGFMGFLLGYEGRGGILEALKGLALALSLL